MTPAIGCELGRIVGLQIQRSSLKVGLRGERYYDPAPLFAVESLSISRDGAISDAAAQLDVHHALHPDSKNVNGKNDISIGFTSGYATMRSRFGIHLRDGIAGENILVACARPLALADLSSGLVIVGTDGRRVEFTNVLVAHPCVEFSRFALYDRGAAPALVSETLTFLDGGVRGFYASFEGNTPVRVELGDCVQLAGHAAV